MKDTRAQSYRQSLKIQTDKNSLQAHLFCRKLEEVQQQLAKVSNNLEAEKRKNEALSNENMRLKNRLTPAIKEVVGTSDCPITCFSSSDDDDDDL
jgi:hypothetical protein